MIQELKNIIHIKLGNIITDAKARTILDKIPVHEKGTVEKILISWSNSFDLPDWVKSEVTINETFFFRHPDQFESIRAELAKKINPKILSIGTSSGEEAYSLAMVCEELGIKDYRIDGVDLDPNVINKARIGRYAPHQIDRTPLSHRPLLMKYGEIKTVCDGTFYVVDPKIQRNVHFIQGNVLTYNQDKYDVIFIRNILIYFSDADKVKIMKKLQDCLEPGGRVVIGPAEVLPQNIDQVA